MILFFLGLLCGAILVLSQIVIEGRYRHSPIKRVEQRVPRAIQGVVVEPKTALQEVLDSEEDIYFKEDE